MSRRVVAVGLAAVLIGLVLPGERGTAQDRLGGPGSGIDKVVVVVEQDHTFDSYFGRYPGAEGLAQRMTDAVSRSAAVKLRVGISTATAGPKRPSRASGTTSLQLPQTSVTDLLDRARRGLH